MFTGLIEEIGTLVGISNTQEPHKLEIVAPNIAPQTRTGDSVAINGCCLTVVARQGDRLTFDLLQESLDRTNFGTLRPGSRVNLEQALSAQSRLGGHFVQGHVDSTAQVLALNPDPGGHRLEIELPPQFARYVAHKGSIALNGVSLTIAEVTEGSFVTRIIPHTLSQTNIANLTPRDLVNLEFDLIAKYLERMLDRSVPSAE
jgi:riboflavin synthase